MEFEKISIDKIKPAPYNPRIMKPSEQLKLKQGLETFGLVDPIIIDLKHENTIIGGHQRYEVLKEENPDLTLKLLRMGDIGLIFNETTFQLKDKNDQKALNLALNKINGDGDYGKLDDLLVELSEEHYNIELTGFDEDELLEDNLFEDILNVSPEISDEKQKNPHQKYTLEIKAPIYVPQEEKAPDLQKCYNTQKMQELQQKIKKYKHKLPKETYDFFIETSHRFVEYDFSNIAEFYTHQTAETQEIMEDLVLIIIDADKAIQKGILKINNEYINDIMNK